MTVWLDSTPIGPAAAALGLRLPLGRYEPYKALVAACVHTLPLPRTYVFLKAAHSESKAVTEVSITRDPEHETLPNTPCFALRDSSLRPSTSLGLQLGMSSAEVIRLLGTPEETDSEPQFKARWFIYHMAKIADTSDVADRINYAQHANVDLTTWFEDDKLTTIKIQRGFRPRYLD